MSAPPFRRSRASVLLARLPLAQSDVAERAEVSRETVNGWACGRTRPSPSARERMEALFGIPAHAWDEPPDVGSSPAIPVATESETRPVGDLFELLRDACEVAARRWRHVSEDKAATPREIEAARKALFDSIEKAERIRQIRAKAPDVSEIVAAVERALGDDTDAIARVRDEFRRMGNG